MTKIRRPKIRFKNLSEKNQRFIYNIVSKIIDSNPSLCFALTKMFRKIGREKTEEIIVELIDRGQVKIIRENRGYRLGVYNKKMKKYI